jgi:fructokinase
MRIGIDLGGTKIEAIGLNSEGKELRRIRIATPRDDYDGTIAAIAGLVSQMEAATHRVGSVGVGIPGTIVAATGLVKNANSTWLNGRPLQKDLSAALEREVRCANDANCLAVSEATDGAGKDSRVVFGVIVGTGCGGGVVIDRKIHAGPNGLAGEWGHIPLPWATANELPGPPCYCGKYGCMETWISGTGLAKEFARVTGGNLRGEQIVEAAAAGDAEAIAALDRWEDRMARGLAVIVNILDPDIIVVGGGLSKLDRLYTGVKARLADLCFGADTDVRIAPAMYGDSSGVRGAAWLWSPERS